MEKADAGKVVRRRRRWRYLGGGGESQSRQRGKMHTKKEVNFNEERPCT